MVAATAQRLVPGVLKDHVDDDIGPQFANFPAKAPAFSSTSRHRVTARTKFQAPFGLIWRALSAVDGNHLESRGDQSWREIGADMTPLRWSRRETFPPTASSVGGLARPSTGRPKPPRRRRSRRRRAKSRPFPKSFGPPPQSRKARSRARSSPVRRGGAPPPVNMLPEALCDARSRSGPLAFVAVWRAALAGLDERPAALIYCAALVAIVVLMFAGPGGRRVGYRRGRFLSASEKAS
jgi:hypothetical protein